MYKICASEDFGFEVSLEIFLRAVSREQIGASTERAYHQNTALGTEQDPNSPAALTKQWRCEEWTAASTALAIAGSYADCVYCVSGPPHNARAPGRQVLQAGFPGPKHDFSRSTGPSNKLRVLCSPQPKPAMLNAAGTFLSAAPPPKSLTLQPTSHALVQALRVPSCATPPHDHANSTEAAQAKQAATCGLKLDPSQSLCLMPTPIQAAACQPREDWQNAGANRQTTTRPTGPWRL